MDTALETHDLTVSYHKRPVLYGVDIQVPSGNLVGIIGPNGAGKSTFIKSVMGVTPISSGWVKFFGGSLKQNIKRIGYVPQRNSVDWDFPVTVMDVALQGTYGKLGMFKRISSKEKTIAMEALEKVGIADLHDRQIGNLSGGQQQRVFLARALAQDSDIYFMDEPFVGVDAATESAIIELLQDMRKQGKTVIVVHHDLQSAPEYFDMLMLLNMRLIGFGKTEDIFTHEMLQKTYGGKLTILNEVATKAAKNEMAAKHDASKTF
ncbi:metal ABC transporter ATP-binding protein [Akkermansiaceae bacterium]|nr:metal ABC transporter ATP-binding protein [Akkermansiaceae bacterium]